ncbi:ankyrin repeat-containing domain protein [Colletotrichum godetiae]|uniref:Ankyrin repeat-containing domain protein n=1 Tax=Colletotrichum godetiae TaxID=1209918 RepID=A0AAJ0ACJ6_9PEZI|nr:ankyrin repeat-containing domain protein [Colletotrichum godetiae]KAK1671415.1 ankyrin repeat-containing domain protein [Colletotrichum godetiae]
MDVASKDAKSQPPLVPASTQLKHMPDVVVLNIFDMLLDDDDVAGYLERVEEGYDVRKECSPDCRHSRGVQNATNLARVCMWFYNIVWYITCSNLAPMSSKKPTWTSITNSTATQYRKWIHRSSAPSREPLPLPMGANPLFFALRGSFDSDNRDSWEATSTRYCRSGTGSFVANDASGSRLETVKALIEAGSSLVTCEKDKVHALHQACAYRDLDVAQFLLDEVGVDPNTEDSKGNTPLHYMAANHQYDPSYNPCYYRIDKSHGPRRRIQDIVNLLIDKGSNLDSKNIDGRTPTDCGFTIY